MYLSAMHNLSHLTRGDVARYVSTCYAQTSHLTRGDVARRVSTCADHRKYNTRRGDGHTQQNHRLHIIFRQLQQNLCNPWIQNLCHLWIKIVFIQLAAQSHTFITPL